LVLFGLARHRVRWGTRDIAIAPCSDRVISPRLKDPELPYRSDYYLPWPIRWPRMLLTLSVLPVVFAIALSTSRRVWSAMPTVSCLRRSGENASLLACYSA